MADVRQIGILGLGYYLPDEVRRNDWWPSELVDGWKQRMARSNRADDPTSPPGEGPVHEAIEFISRDPFQGSVERRVMPDGMQSSDMEIAAAKQALAAASVPADEVDLLVVGSWMPDLLGTNVACTVQEGLGLPIASLCLSIDSNFNAIHHQIAIAEALIASGRARYALLVQSTNGSRFVAREQAYSPWFGDAATAVVLGPVAEGFGVLGRAHRADGSKQHGLLIGVPGGQWFDEGRSVLWCERPERQHKISAQAPQSSREVIHSALADAQLTVDDVDFYACHQGTWWYRHVTQTHAGLGHARTFDIFAKLGTLAGCNVPMVLSRGLERGLLHDGDIVVTHAGGTGATWSAMVLRWGTGAVQ